MRVIQLAVLYPIKTIKSVIRAPLKPGYELWRSHHLVLFDSDNALTPARTCHNKVLSLLFSTSFSSRLSSSSCFILKSPTLYSIFCCVPICLALLWSHLHWFFLQTCFPLASLPLVSRFMSLTVSSPGHSITVFAPAFFHSGSLAVFDLHLPFLTSSFVWRLSAPLPYLTAFLCIDLAWIIKPFAFGSSGFVCLAFVTAFLCLGSWQK